MLPKDINNITEPVYKRLHKEIDAVAESVEEVLPDASEASVGQVLKLDSDKKPIWSDDDKEPLPIEITVPSGATLADFYTLVPNNLQLAYYKITYYGQYGVPNTITGYLSTTTHGTYVFDFLQYTKSPFTQVMSSGRPYTVVGYKRCYHDVAGTTLFYTLIDWNYSAIIPLLPSDNNKYVLECENQLPEWKTPAASGTKLYEHTIIIESLGTIHAISLSNEIVDSFSKLQTLLDNSIRNYRDNGGSTLFGRNVEAVQTYDPSQGGVVSAIRYISVSYATEGGSTPLKITWTKLNYSDNSITDTVTEL